MTDSSEEKAERKVSAAEANDTARFEDTEFGRRRISKMPKWLATLVWLVRTPIVFIYRRLRGSPPG